MEEKFGFTKMRIQEFESWILTKKIGRTVLKIQQHHTFIPDYKNFERADHFELQRRMQNFHVDERGWQDIGQHLSIFPDGQILTGRSFEIQPACIFGQNRDAFCIENVGNFHEDKDEMTDAQKDSIVRVTAMLCHKFGLDVNDKTIVYHHWFDLNSGTRNNGAANNKTCPGTTFFGGNKVEDFQGNLQPLIEQRLGEIEHSLSLQRPVLAHAVITAMKLNVRIGPSHTFSLAADREPIPMGSVVRVFEESANGWLRISSSSPHWVSGKFTDPVRKGKVTAPFTTARSGPGEDFEPVMDHVQGEVLFFAEEEGGWHRQKMAFSWLPADDLALEET